MSRTNVFTLDSYVEVTTFIPVPLVEMYGHMFLLILVLSAETSMDAITRSSVHAEPSDHVLTRSYVHMAPMYKLMQYLIYVLPRASLIVLLHVYVSMHRLPQAFVHMPLQASVLALAVPHV